nr:uncharacterized protein LOC124810576 [Hydra vulgaris]
MRTYKRKTEKGLYPKEVVIEAASHVIDGRVTSVRASAKKFGIHYSTLSRYIKKVKKAVDMGMPLPYPGYKKNQVFTYEQEIAIASYISICSDIYFGLSPYETRKLAFECAVKYGIIFPKSWLKHSMAGPDWMRGFLNRHPRLSIRTPEATSLARATSFNRANVGVFFQKLSDVLDRHHFSASNIFNVDETGITTVQKPNKIIARKGIKQVGALTSQERGTLVTMVIAVNAYGNSVPPMFLFPRKKFFDHFIRDGPNGCIGASNGSGWMNEECFITYINHFIRHVKPSKESPVLLLLDNHQSHLSIQLITLCKDNGIVLLSFPPHCSHKLQPLDRSVFGPFKKCLANAQDSWIKSSPGKTMSIYDLPGIAKIALQHSLTQQNISSGFRVAGILPYNKDIFSDADFAPSFVTDRPAIQSNAAIDISISTSTSDAIPSAVSKFSPEVVRPLPKARPRKEILTRSKRKHTEVLTDTPVKQRLMAEKEISSRKRKSASTSASKKKTIKKYNC